MTTAETGASDGGKGAKTGDEGLSREALIVNRRGLHARAAAKFVKTVEAFEADVYVAKKGQEVSGRSIMGLMMLAAAPGCVIELRAQGTDADKALDAVCNLIARKFEEDD